ncbi:response regulator [Adhaeretor mobilis]|uniref:Response regulator PleD n=1 Tax=Adhaeretor mobilis TaxID=1930276 RepID=A0A517MU58_9BACT|nr:response regulator [Adhaeretor mobilis]QDS98307.1 Response regulator PleD [Adhaeretor mobilis]
MLENKKILLVDDDDDALQAIGARCRSVGMQVFTARNLLTALGQVEKQRPDVVCVDVQMPTGNGIGFCEMLANDHSTAHIPRILITGNATAETQDSARRLNAPLIPKSMNVWETLLPLLQQVAGDSPQTTSKAQSPKANLPKVDLAATRIVLPLPLAPKQSDAEPEVASAATIEADQELLLDSVFAMLGSELGEDEAEFQTYDSGQEETPPWVLCIDDDADFTDALRCRLESHGVAVVRAFDGMEGYRTAFAQPARAIILDFEMPNGHGDYVLRRLKENPVTADIPVVMLTGNKDRNIQRRLMALGAVAYFNKPVRFDQLRGELSNYIEILDTPLVSD